MWKYLTKEAEIKYLLSIHLIDGTSDKDILNKIYTISNNKEKNYKIYKIKKKNGHYRTIYAPKPNLLIIQKNILKNILEKRSISKYARAYKKGITLVDNAKEHLNKKIILKLDIKDFFNSIQYIQIYNTCFPQELFPKSIGTLLTNLCSCYDILPQGAPTSSYISNLVMYNFDIIIGTFCDSRNIAYTRYCDDMTFSGDFDYHEIINLVKQELTKLNLSLNIKKIHVITQKSRQIVTGVVVNKKLQVAKYYRQEIRKDVYYIKKYGLISHLGRTNNKMAPVTYLNTLLGKINYVLQIDKSNKEFINYKKEILKTIKNIHNKKII